MSHAPTHPFIDGQFREDRSSGTFPLVNPATEEAWAELGQVSETVANQAIESAYESFESSWRDLAPGARARILFDIAAEIRHRLEPV